VAQLYPLGTGFLFVTSYDSQDYGGGILTHLGNAVLSLVYLKYVAVIGNSFFLGAEWYYLKATGDHRMS
jgi:hypothetical protein